MDASKKPPPPPAKPDTREHPRYELMASVELHDGAETAVLPAKNLSLGGIYVHADGNNLMDAFGIGHVVEVLVFNATDENHPAVRGKAKVVRFDTEGMALKWEASLDTSKELSKLLDAIKPRVKPGKGAKPRF